jgi:hypothetical protein
MPLPLSQGLSAWWDERRSSRSRAWAGRMAWLTVTRSRTTVLGGTGAGVGVARLTPDRGG